MLKIKVVNKGHQPLPQYATEQSAGMDLRANLEAPVMMSATAYFENIKEENTFVSMISR